MSQTEAPVKVPVSPMKRTFHGCSKIHEYEVICKLGEGTFGEVHKARSKKTGAVVALKKILMHNEKDGFPITALREIKLLKSLSHVNILKLEEMAVERPKGEGRKRAILYMVTPYMEHDLSGLLDNPDVRFTEPQIKCYMLQLLEGLKYLHNSNILHRDMKAANLLINNRGILQIADFGLARHYDEPVPQPGRGNGEARRDYTTLVVTRWYRPPELLLQLRRYTPAVDMWGAGCVFGEMFKRKPILAGTSDLNQAHIIFDLVGSPNDESMPGWRLLPGCDGVKEFAHRTGNLAQVFREQGSSAISLLGELLKLDWRKRINAHDALLHPYFKQEPLPARPEDLPRFTDSHELDRRNARGQKAALPPAPAGGTVGMGANGEWGTGSGPNNAPWMNGDRGPSRAWGGPQDRGPPGAGPQPSHGLPAHHRDSYASHGTHDPGYRGVPAGRRPPWQADGHAQHYPPSMSDRPARHSGLPPPPPEGSRHPLPNNPHKVFSGTMDGGRRDRVPRHNRDSYVPSYGESGRGDRRSRDPEDRRNSLDYDGRPPSRGQRQNDREYRDRDRDRERYGRDRRTRSRSPDPRDRRQERERDIYRR